MFARYILGIALGGILICHSVTGANVIFIHPDGAGVSHWQAARFYWVGPDKDLNWDKLENTAIYRGHMDDSLTASSNGGATVHAYGVKASYGAFGSDAEGARPVSAAGKSASILHDAIEAGVPTGLVNSGSIIEPGTAAFAASVKDRNNDSADVVRQVIESGTHVILSGGEEWFLPEGTQGKFCATGQRKDGRNLITEARQLGYEVVFTVDELRAVPSETPKVLGIFCEGHTFNDMSEVAQKETGKPTYKPGVPTVAEMTSEALRLLGGRGKDFFLVVEEEGTDNFGNNNNAVGTLDALKRADDAFGVALEFLDANPNTLIITAADSSAGGMDVIGLPVNAGPDLARELKRELFVAKSDRSGRELPFVITWATTSDASGGIVVRGAGKNANEIKGSFDNTKIYSLMRKTLFDGK